MPTDPQYQELATAVSLLDSDFKSWAAKRYGLISAGPPPKYERNWTPDDLIFAQQWDGWLNQFRNTPVTADNAVLIQRDIENWQSLAVNREIDLTDPNEEKPIRTSPDVKSTSIPWGKVAIGAGIAGAAYLYLSRKKPEVPGAVVAEQPIPLEERVSRLMTTGTKTSRR